MDPYIEDPEIWSDFHGRLADEISAQLNQGLGPRYVARLTPRLTYETIEIGERRSVRPDVGVWQPQPPSGEPSRKAGVAVAEPVENSLPMEVPQRLYSVHVLEVASLRRVTAIEILSPVNKRKSHEACEDYLRKRRAGSLRRAPD